MNQEIIDQLFELRKRLIFILVGFFVAFLAIFHFIDNIFHFVAKPLLHYLVPMNSQLIATDILSPFFVPLKLGVITAVLISMPNTMFQLWRYIAPGLYKKERRLTLAICILALVLFIIGVAFCYYLVLPLLFQFIKHIKSSDIQMLTDITKYLDFVLNLFLIFGISFELPILIFILLYLKIIEIKKLRSLRSYIFVLCFIIAAIVTPPDVLSQSALALSLYLLYELGMLLVYLI